MENRKVYQEKKGTEKEKGEMIKVEKKIRRDSHCRYSITLA